MVAGRRGGSSDNAPGTRVRPGTEAGTRQRLGDFYLYPLKDRTTIASGQTKQVGFLDVQGAAARKAYEARLGWLETVDTPRSVSTMLKFANSRSAGLGDQLPEGMVRVYLRDQRGAPQFIGESAIPHTPMGSEIALRTGDAFDVKLRVVTEKRERVGDSRWRTTMRYTLSNARAEPVTVDLVQQGFDTGYRDVRILEQSLPGERPSVDAVQWRVPVPAQGESVVTATFETRF